MRIRRKKHILDRLNDLNGLLLVADLSNPDTRNIEKQYFDYEKIFKNNNPICLEVGCGKGGFIIENAVSNPNKNYIAVELIDNIIVMAGEKAKKLGLKNVLFFNSGADYLSRYILDNSIAEIFLNFSPPFPGKRYENRRLTKPELVEDYYKFLIKGGVVTLKTDDKDFFDYSFEKFSEKNFSVIDCTIDYEKGKISSVQTEYEKKFRDLNMPIYMLKAKKE